MSSIPASLTDIHAPVKVGIPPENAFCGLVQLPNGELRHYGHRGAQNRPFEHIYIASHDNGLTWDDGTVVTGKAVTGESGPPAAHVPWSGSFVRIVSRRDRGTFALRSTTGIDGTYDEQIVDGEAFIMIRQPVFLTDRKRMLVTAHRGIERDGEHVQQSAVFRSDDDGTTWTRADVPVGPIFVPEPPHEMPRWRNTGLEPTLVGLNDGRVWMLLRTSMDTLYESFSNDGGVTWTEQIPSHFYATLTMPTLFRMNDGRLLLFWCNTTPLPEVDRSNDMSIRPEQRTGEWEDVFTNRDATHAAISEDDGRTWVGFRELWLNPLRNEPDFATRGGNESSLDKSVQQAQAIELPEGKILVALGQHPLVRSLVIFDPAWLYETERSCDFSNGLDDWSSHQFITGIEGHCAYDRKPGPILVPHPDDPERNVLHIRRIPDPSLVSDRQGAVWNFPAAHAGALTIRLRLNPGSAGGRISLNDRWFNPTDDYASTHAMYSTTFSTTFSTTNTSDILLEPGQWHELRFEWNDVPSGPCRLSIGINSTDLPAAKPSINGISYVHLQTLSDSEDTAGFVIESVDFRHR